MRSGVEPFLLGNPVLLSPVLLGRPHDFARHRIRPTCSRRDA
ncbi:Hypothetical protein CAP_5120 [Chondromyces apiculatus DSM 436]|uniref:Uncharacterized protein n=1 Tax=Chondromyces apiculatus DSM 436 TaxID=1192034 RepID=A0A017T5K1_9BACT|nr:Hypothetical protein CAP_5120 [Chondromyces apiculatus DSM 436]